MAGHVLYIQKWQRRGYVYKVWQDCKIEVQHETACSDY